MGSCITIILLSSHVHSFFCGTKTKVLVHTTFKTKTEGLAKINTYTYAPYTIYYLWDFYLHFYFFLLSVCLITFTFQYNVTMKMSTHEHTGIIHIDFYLHRALLTQSFNHSRLRSFIACIALRVVNRLLTVTLDISAFRLGSQTRQDNRWRTKRPTIDQPFIPASQLMWHWAFNDGFNIYPINEYNTGGAFIQITSITSSLS